MINQKKRKDMLRVNTSMGVSNGGFKSGDISCIWPLIMNSNCQTMTEESKIVLNVRNMRERMVGRTKVEGLKKISKTAAAKDNTR
jgi:hypothetical protein